MKIINIIGKENLAAFYLIVFLSLFAFLFELISIAAIIPVLQFMIKGERFFDQTKIFTDLSGNEFFNILLISIIIIFSIKSIYIIFFNKKNLKFIFKIKNNLFKKIMNKYFNVSYLNFHNIDNSKKISTLTHEINHFTSHYLNSIILLIPEIILIIFIFLYLLYLNFFGTVIVTFIILLSSFFYYLFLIKKIKKLGSRREQLSRKFILTLNECFAFFKEIIIFDKKKKFLKKYESVINENLHIEKNIIFYQILPKIIFEQISIFFLIFLIFILKINNFPLNTIVYQISIYTIAFIKVIPSVIKIVINLNNIKYSKPSLQRILDVYNLNESKNLIHENKFYKKDKIINFDNLSLFNIKFEYKKAKKTILNNINLKIINNDKIAIIGRSGSGKTTLLNVILGLITPTSGDIKLNGKSIDYDELYKLNFFGYTSQSTNIIKGKIYNNVAFGIDDEFIDHDKVNVCLKTVNLNDFTYDLKKNNAPDIEENLNISGGEAQRISIARNLYLNSQVLIFDEPTSSLDQTNKESIINLLLKLNKTIILITHDKEIAKTFSKIINLDEQ